MMKKTKYKFKKIIIIASTTLLKQIHAFPCTPDVGPPFIVSWRGRQPKLEAKRRRRSSRFKRSHKKCKAVSTSWFAPGTFCACALTLQFIGMTTRYIGSAQSQMCTLKILIHLEEDGSI